MHKEQSDGAGAANRRIALALVLAGVVVVKLGERDVLSTEIDDLLVDVVPREHHPVQPSSADTNRGQGCQSASG